MYDFGKGVVPFIYGYMQSDSCEFTRKKLHSTKSWIQSLSFKQIHMPILSFSEYKRSEKCTLKRSHQVCLEKNES